MSKTTVVYEGLIDPKNIIATQAGDVMEERDALKQKLAESHGEPVALPERMEPNSHLAQQRDWKWSEGWNAYRDEMIKLGPLYTRPVQGALVAWQFQGRDGTWYPCQSEKHRADTEADGTWPMRALYALADPGEVERLRTDVDNWAGKWEKVIRAGAAAEEERDTLRAQLTEARRLFTLLTKNPHLNTGGLDHEMNAFLYFSAEPITFPGYPPVPEDRKLPATSANVNIHAEAIEEVGDEDPEDYMFRNGL